MWGLSVLTTILAILLFATSADAIVEEVTGPFCSGMDYLLVSFCNNPDKAIECGGFRQIEEFDQHTDPPDLVRFSKANLVRSNKYSVKVFNSTFRGLLTKRINVSISDRYNDSAG